MTLNPNAPHFILAAVCRIYAELPSLVGVDEWPEIQPQVKAHIMALESQPNAYSEATQLFGLLAQYVSARTRLNQEIKIQEIVSTNINAQMEQMTVSLGYDPAMIDGLMAAAFARLKWDVDPSSIPTEDENTNRSITMSEGGEDAVSLKFKNLTLDLGDFAKIAGGFATTGYSIIEKIDSSHLLLLVAAGVLLVISTLHDAMEIELSEHDASVFWGMIQATGEMRGAGLIEANIIAATNTERVKYGLEPLKVAEVRHALTKLERINSIEQTGKSYRVIERYTIKD